MDDKGPNGLALSFASDTPSQPDLTCPEKGEIQVEWTRKVQHNKTTLILKLHFITKLRYL